MSQSFYPSLRQQMFFAYVEDDPSQAVLQKIFIDLNTQSRASFSFRAGYPRIMRGSGQIKNQLSHTIEMGRQGMLTFSLLDLDRTTCPAILLRSCLNLKPDQAIILPRETLIRVAVREIESWVLADVEALSEFTGISETNFPYLPDSITNIKEHFLSIIQRKGTRRGLRAMLPKPDAHIGPEYNDRLREFIINHWRSDQAARRSPSLKRTLDKLREFEQ
ncbi:MAG: hypothetical protein ACRC10_06870 [Thermoguttaceae bacterium]